MQDLQLEKLVIGAILNDPAELVNVSDILSPECFTDRKNAEIYRTIERLYESDDVIDLSSVRMKSKPPDMKPGEIVRYLTECALGVSTSANLVNHSQALKDLLTRRTILSNSTRIASLASDPDIDVSDALDEFSKLADLSAQNAFGGTGVRHVGDIASEALQMLEKRQSQSGCGFASGVTTGLSEFDTLTGGLQPGQLVILGARPAMGKSALMLHIAKSAAKSGIPVCIFSLEMSDISLADRLILSECNVRPEAFKLSNPTPQEWAEIEQAKARLQNLPIYIDSNPVVSMRQIKTRAKILNKKGRCGLIIVDYLQLAADTSGNKNRNREQEIAQMSRQAKIIAKMVGVPFVLLSQLSRQCESRGSVSNCDLGFPQLSDLRESGAIEQDADIVTLLWRPSYYDIQSIPSNRYGQISTDGLASLYVAKHRNGPTRQIYFRHNPSMTKIVDFEERVTDMAEPF